MIDKRTKIGKETHQYINLFKLIVYLTVIGGLLFGVGWVIQSVGEIFGMNAGWLDEYMTELLKGN